VKRKIKILRILNRFNVGGPVYNATYLTKYLNSNLYETFLIGGMPENHEKSAKYILNDLNIPFKEMKFMKRSVSPFLDFISLVQIIFIIYKYKPDIIHTHAAKAGLLGRFASFFYFRKVRVVHTYHGNVFEGYFSPIINKIILSFERFLARHSTKIVAISKLQFNDLVFKYKICEKDKIEIVPLGFDLYRFTKNVEFKREKTRNEFNIKNDDILITIIGRIVPIKNHIFFLDVIKYCKEKSKKNIKVLVVGDGNQTEDILKYTKKINLTYSYKNPNLDCDIMFTSWRSDIDNILAASDVVCLTSLNEGTPVSIIEAMASKTAAISTNVGGVSDIIENNISGIVSLNNIEDFSTDLLKLINDEKFRKRIAENAQAKSLENFNFNKLVSNIESLYKKII
jgi:glycosyltransferase involved in cell wall biosynthesis